jgi:4-hydroxybenzoate polyprenyltransferase
MMSLIEVLRLHHWIKNLLIFLPFVASQQIFSENVMQNLFLGFLSFGLLASATYILNDIVDLKNDRKHITKKYRPIPSGKISIQTGFLIIVILITTIFFITKKLEQNNFLLFLIGYLGLSLFYSLYLKKIVLLDCFLLSILYTIRIFAGGELVDITPSFWLTTFSMFLFLSLAFLKRYSEISLMRNKQAVLGRNYYGSDKSLIKMLGINSGYISILVLVLYLNSDTVFRLYQSPEWIWPGVVSFLFWINWIWLKAHRNQMNQDPIVFAIKDKVSILLFVLSLIFYLLSSN